MDDRERLLSRLARVIADDRVLAAIAAVPRDAFVPEALQARAWEDCALPIGSGQTISQPFVVARMCELLALRGGERVLDVGTGSGYHAAVLAAMGARVWSIERHAELSREAARALERADVRGVTLLVGDGCAGLPDVAPFDAINVAAAAEHVAELDDLRDQLAPGGRLVAPVGGPDQRLVVLRRGASGWSSTDADPVRFVPLVPDFPAPTGMIRRRGR
ncbi:protein-L-isoaspartate(D-aspartate) O-methyltransferase [Svornostia abyssi]|uniref:Protein-L-isoaspartate O-methyltransferase n=1 Tax=Svornostia abyssi TaxID=2898438 RepID=A0ABY5PCK6_9ACTN|nr:protein-L-isoaspartate(D-aspartate) O-methyltransferase [Parviterribacteraceae bacterium J379]